jgi:hypothetical protein
MECLFLARLTTSTGVPSMGSVIVFLSSSDVVTSSYIKGRWVLISKGVEMGIAGASSFGGRNIYIANKIVALGGDGELGRGSLDRNCLEDCLQLVAQCLGAVARLSVLKSSLNSSEITSDGVEEIEVVRRRECQ